MNYKVKTIKNPAGEKGTAFLIRDLDNKNGKMFRYFLAAGDKLDKESLKELFVELIKYFK